MFLAYIQILRHASSCEQREPAPREIYVKIAEGSLILTPKSKPLRANKTRTDFQYTVKWLGEAEHSWHTSTLSYLFSCFKEIITSTEFDVALTGKIIQLSIA